MLHKLKKTSKILSVLLLLAFLFLVYFYWSDVSSDRRHSIKILKQTPIHDGWELGLREPNIGFVEAGDVFPVLRIRYGKDFRAIKIKLKDGSTSWVIESENILLEQQGSP